MTSASDATDRSQRLAIVALVAAAGLWSLNGPLIKVMGATGTPAVSIAFYRSLLGGLVFLPMALRERRTLRDVPLRLPIACVLAFTLMTVCFVIATAQTAAANAIILQYTSPVWVFLLSPLLLREPAGRGETVMLALAMVGVGIIFFGSAATDLLGLSVALLSGLGYGALTVLFRGLARVDAGASVAINMLGSALLLAPAVAIWGTFALDGRQLGLALLLGVVQFSFPYLLFAWALKRIAAQRASLIVLLETVLNPLWTWLIVGERVPAATLLGGPLILASAVVWIVGRRRH